MSSHFLLYRNDGTIFDLPVQSGPTFGNTAQLGKWDNNWTHIRPFGLSGQPYFLLYKQSSGEAFTMPIHTGEEYGVATACGKWETDWAQITPFSAGGKDFLLLYRTNGVAFYLPIRSGPSFGTPVALGTWENDWAQIRSFMAGSVPQLLFYRTSGEVFTAPIHLSGTDLTPLAQRSPVIGNTTPGGTWETDWAEMAAFEVADLTFGIDRIDIINQKSDSDHADNDYLSLVWTITKAVTKEQIPYSKTIPIPGALRSGESVSGPFSINPFNLDAGDVLTKTAIVSNLGSSDVNQQFAQAVQITKKTVDDLVPVVAVIVGSILGGAVGPIGGFEKGKEITDAFDWAVQGLSDLADSFGLHIGPGNCNGVVLSASWIYSSSDFPAAVGVSGSEHVDGPAKSGCGTAPSTNLSWSVRPA